MSEASLQRGQSFEEDSSLDQIRQQLANTDIHLSVTDIEIDADRAFKIPFDQIPSLGVGLASLPTMFRSVSTTANAPTLLQATDKWGMPLDPSILNSFNDGSGLLGSFSDPVKGFGQARFHPVELGDIQCVTTMPYDPTSLFVAAALAQINQKLDSIQDTVNEMFEYMRQKDKAELRGNVRTLEDTLEAYKNNWNNKTWLQNAHMKVLDIKQESEKAIVHLRAQIKSKLEEKGPVEIRLAVGGRLDEVLDRLKEYQLAVYTYSFSSFLEPLLSENFSESNLSAIADKISERSVEYHELYSECYNAIEESSNAAVDSQFLGGVSAALSGFGDFMKQTPFGSFTPIDDALHDAGRGVGEFNEGQTRELMDKLHEAKTPDVLPFRQSLESVSVLYNQPHQIAIDQENVYLLQE